MVKFLSRFKSSLRNFSYPALAAFFMGFLFFPASSMAQKTKPTFSATLINIEAATNATFTFNTTLHNTLTQAATYNLNVVLPSGWTSSFRVEGSQVTSVKVQPNQTESITIQFYPAPSAKPGKYNIPVTAISQDGSDTLSLQLQAVVKGSYALQLTTPSGRLSDNVTEGSQKQIQLVVNNSGSIALKDIDLSAQTPTDWEATFEPSKIDNLQPGKSVTVTATLKVPDKTIAGDYVTTFNAKETNVNATATFRMTVETSILSGWIGILVILIAIGIIY
ncbi:NEW3 domain-containing protein, partial [Arachidicoccus sp.]|uniref:COG1470 family protein n=1 Tax=Arachidicoccus sp. TaxID=1872624 RepID=UPI003D20C340